MKNGFDMKTLLNTTSLQPDNNADPKTTPQKPTRRPIFKTIPINVNDLVPSSDNFYSMDNISELKTQIEMFGVLTNLTVKPKKNGKYEILAGHRRHKACVELVAEGKAEFQYVPCAIQGERDDIKERILMIITNSTTRELSDWEKMKQAEELSKYFTALKKRDNLTGRTRDLVAEALNTSSTQIARFTAITKNLSPLLQEEFKAGRIGLSAAYEISSLPEATQVETLKNMQKNNNGLSLNDVKELKQDTTTAANTQHQTKKRNTLVDSMGVHSPPPPPPHDSRNPPKTENIDFADLPDDEKATTAITFLNRKKFTLLTPGEDTRVFDFIIDALGTYVEYAGWESVEEMQNVENAVLLNKKKKS